MKWARLVDLFAGIGGFSWAGREAGWESVYASDFDRRCKETFEANFASPFALKDIRQKSEGEFLSVAQEVGQLEFELLTAGFPCQSFSKAGAKLGFADPKGRGELFFDLEKVLIKSRPPALLLENVGGLQRHGGGQSFGVMLERLAILGYYCQFARLNTVDYTRLPQNRDRLYVVGFLKAGQGRDFVWPEPVREILPWRELLQTRVSEKYFCHFSKLERQKSDFPFQAEQIYLYRRNHWRAYQNGVFPTLLATMGSGGGNVPLILVKRGLRKITPREAARLQGFRDDFRLPESLADKHLYGQLGNSISIPLVAEIMRRILAVL